VDTPIAEPPTAIPHQRSRAQIAAASPSTPTSIQCRIWMRSMLARIVELLKAPQHLDEAHEGGGGGPQGQDDRCPGGPPQVAVEAPADYPPGRDRPRDLESDRHAAGIAHRSGRARQLSAP